MLKAKFQLISMSSFTGEDFLRFGQLKTKTDRDGDVSWSTVAINAIFVAIDVSGKINVKSTEFFFFKKPMK